MDGNWLGRACHAFLVLFVILVPSIVVPIIAVAFIVRSCSI